jgi:hypothetical protein
MIIRRPGTPGYRQRGKTNAQVAGLSNYNSRRHYSSNLRDRLEHLLPCKDRQKKYDHKDGDEQEEEESGDIRSPRGDAGESEQRGDDCDDQEYCSPF